MIIDCPKCRPCPVCRNSGQVEIVDHNPPSNKLLAHTIIADVAQEYQLPKKSITGVRRTKMLVDARTVAARRMRERGMSLKEIGFYLCRDHSSIHHLLNTREVS